MQPTSPSVTDPLPTIGYPHAGDRRYIVNRQLLWLTLFSQQDTPGLSWRTRLTQMDADRKTNIYKIIAKNLKENTEKEIYRSNGSIHIRLSPDGKWLAIQAYYTENDLVPDKIPSLSIIPSAGGEPRVLCRFEEGIDIHAGAPFTWTADGKHILFTVKTTQNDDKKGELYRIPAEGGEPEKLGLEINGFIIITDVMI